MNLKDGDTIAAVATATGKSGIGVVRISGHAVAEIALQITGVTLEPRKAHYSRFTDAQGRVIDEGIAILYQAPASFTGEDVLELQAHGSPIVLDLILERVLQLGARIAQPGEFSQRAFLNNKYDLVQLEAIADLVNSASHQAARGAQRALQGEISAKFRKISARLKSLRVRVEAELDFSDEDIEHSSLTELRLNIKDLIDKIKRLKKVGQQSLCLYEGAEIVIVGQTNVGKSSLLNRLAQREAAIVNAQPGTTRDIVSSDFAVGGVPIRVSDTAGLRQTVDPIEQEGIRRTRVAMQESDLLLLLVDARRGISDIERTVLKQFEDQTMLVIANKIDLLDAPVSDTEIDVPISAKTGEGIETLTQKIKECLTHGSLLDAERSVWFANRRHLSALAVAEVAAAKALSELADTDRPNRCRNTELVAENLRVAQQALANITGAYGSEELLSDIFSRFCIGK